MSRKALKKSPWSGVYYGNHLGYVIFQLFLQTVGLRITYFFLHFVVLYYYFFRLPKDSFTKQFKENYNQWEKRSRKLSFFYGYKRVYQFGQILVDRLALRVKKDIFSLTHTGVDNLTTLTKSGGILLGSHMGNWEIGLPLIQKYQKTMPSVAMVVITDALQEITKIDKTACIIPIHIEDKNLLITLKTHIESGKVIALHGDRYWKNMRSLEVDFMGKPARFPVGAFITATIFEKPLAFVNVFKRGTFSYELVCSSPKLYQWNRNISREKQLKIWAEEYVQFLEEGVRKFPEQWFNFYDFWKEKDKQS